MILDFVAFDFETADAYCSAPCSLGITAVKNGLISFSSNYFINPDCDFSQDAIRIHGITPMDVAFSPLFPEIWDKVSDWFTSFPIVAHKSSFDVSVLKKALARYGLPFPEMIVYDTCFLAKKIVPDVQNYKLETLCDYFDIPLDNAHNSECDSVAAANLFLRLQETNPFAIRGKTTSDQPRGNRPRRGSLSFANIPCYRSAEVEYDDAQIVFTEHTFVITGELEGYSRDELYSAIRKLGGCTAAAVSKNVDYVVVGKQNIAVVKDKASAKSEKILKAEQLRMSGEKVRIVDSSSFLDALKREKQKPAQKRALLKDEIDLANNLSMRIKQVLSPCYADLVSFESVPTAVTSSFDVLLTFKVQGTVYRPDVSVTIARLKTSGTQWISFPPRSASLFDSLGINYSVIKSESPRWPRVHISEFMKKSDLLYKKFDQVFLGEFNFTKFGCCGKYEKCSDEGHCLHDDLIYAAAACEYKKHLDSGRVFYGKNKNN